MGNMNERSDPPVRPGFLLALVVVLALVLLAYIALPSLAGSTKAKLPQIISNLRQLDLSKEMWASDHSATAGALVSEQDLAKYLGPRVSSTGLVVSVDSETYSLNPIGTPPEARLEKSIGRFPKGMLMRWSTNGGCEILLPNPQGGANGWQPLHSGTNRTSAAAATRRSP